MTVPSKRCARCGYLLTPRSDRCPECGDSSSCTAVAASRGRIITIRAAALATMALAVIVVVLLSRSLADLRAQLPIPPIPPPQALSSRISMVEQAIVAAGLIAAAAAIAGFALPWVLRVRKANPAAL